MIDNSGNAYVSNGTRKIDIDLKFHSGISLIINTNKEIKEEKVNGTLCGGK